MMQDELCEELSIYDILTQLDWFAIKVGEPSRLTLVSKINDEYDGTAVQVHVKMMLFLLEEENEYLI